MVYTLGWLAGTEAGFSAQAFADYTPSQDLSSAKLLCFVCALNNFLAAQ